jgi:hypothetical protein
VNAQVGTAEVRSALPKVRRTSPLGFRHEAGDRPHMEETKRC